MRLFRDSLLLTICSAALSAQPVDLIFALETTPGTEQATAMIRPKDLGDDDRAGVVGFHRSAKLTGPLTEDRQKLGQALDEAGARIGVAIGIHGGAPLNRSFTVDLADAILKAGAELAAHPSPRRKRAIVLYFAGEDPKLGAHVNTLQSMLAAADIRLYAVLVYRTDVAAPPGMPSLGGPTRRNPIPVQSPAATVEWVSKLAKASGGKLYRSNWALGKILAAARKP